MPDADPPDDAPDLGKWVYKPGDTETEIVPNSEPLWTKVEADEWAEEIDDLLAPSPKPFTWIDEDLADDDFRE